MLGATWEVVLGGGDSKRGTQQFGDSFNGGQLSFNHAGAIGGWGRECKRGGGGAYKVSPNLVG